MKLSFPSHLWLGDVLWAMDCPDKAVVEYGKANQVISDVPDQWDGGDRSDTAA